MMKRMLGMGLVCGVAFGVQTTCFVDGTPQGMSFVTRPESKELKETQDSEETHATAQEHTLTRRGTAPVIVRFAGGLPADWRARMAAAGARIIGYVPEDGCLVEAPAGLVAALAARKDVRAVEAFAPARKLAPLPKAIATNAVAAFIVELLSADDIEDVTAVVRQCGGSVAEVIARDDGARLVCELPVALRGELARLGAVQYVQARPQYQLLNNVAVQAGRLNVEAVWQTNWLGLTGKGQVVGHADTGMDLGVTNATMHPDFTNRIRRAYALGRATLWNDPNGHGTHTAGSLMGNGSAYSNGLFKGVAYEAEIVHQSIYSNAAYETGGLPADLRQLFTPPYSNDGVRVHSDSWGQPPTLDPYPAEARDVDDFVWRHPEMLIVMAAGNFSADYSNDGVIDGGFVASPAIAKNVLTVGASESGRPPSSGGLSAVIYGTGEWEPYAPANPVHDDYVSSSADGVHQGMFAWSSRGPAVDGRIKPDVVGPGTDIISCRSRASGDLFWGAYNNEYLYSGGTSMATPLVAGCAALVRQYFAERHAPAITNPSAALVKGVLVNGAVSLTPGQYGYEYWREIPAQSPNAVEGWGQVNLANSLSNLTVYDRLMLTNGQREQFTLGLSATDDVALTLVWMDYPGTLGVAPTLVNDVDVWVIGPDGATNYANGQAGPDRTNTVERILVRAAAPGVYTIEVSGARIVEGPQPCALVVRSLAAQVQPQQIVNVQRNPVTVRPERAVQIEAVVKSNYSGIAAVTLTWRVNAGAAQSVAMEQKVGFEDGAVYQAVIDALPLTSKVQYQVDANGNDGGATTSAWQSYVVESARVCVAPDGLQLAPYDTWALAFTNMQAAVDYVSNGWMIVVTSGVYRADMRGTGDGLLVNKVIELRGVKGAAETVLDGQNMSRALTMLLRETVMEGFTLQRGLAYNSMGAANGGGGYIIGGTLRRCEIRDSRAQGFVGYGGGLDVERWGELDGCLLAGNVAAGLEGYGGGARLWKGGVLRNCVVVRNQGTAGGGLTLWAGGAVTNCTVALNTATRHGGVSIVSSGAVHNSIIMNNTGGNLGTDVTGMYSWCCVTPAPPGGLSNITSDARFVNAAEDDVRLATNSPCIDAGQTAAWMTNALDADGGPRVRQDAVDMGAYEFGQFHCSVSANQRLGLTPFTPQFSAHLSGTNTSAYLWWDVNGDGVWETQGWQVTRTSFTYTNSGFFTVSVLASNTLGETVWWTGEDFIKVYAGSVHYVAHGGGHVWPYTSWADAATNIAAALSTAPGGHMVLVSNGVHYVASTLMVSNAVPLRSLNGAEVTTLRGPANIRAVYLNNAGAVLDGFRISGFNRRQIGEGGTAVLMRNGALIDCIIESNIGENAVVQMSGGVMSNTLLRFNRSYTYGSAVWCDGGGLVQNCVIVSNTGYLGAVILWDGGTIRNSVICDNTNYLGGGVYLLYGDTIENCTIVGNHAAGNGGGVAALNGGVVRNNIIMNNFAKTAGTNVYVSGTGQTLLRNCMPAETACEGIVTNAPLFVDEARRDFRLRAASPCRNAGTNMAWMTAAVDIAGTPRIVEGIVEIGAYEFPNLPMLAVTPHEHDFGELIAGETGVVSSLVINIGSCVLTAEVSGVSAPFSVPGGQTYWADESGTTEVFFVFTPVDAGSWTNTVWVSGAGDSVAVTLHGSAVPEPGLVALAIGLVGFKGYMLRKRCMQ